VRARANGLLHRLLLRVYSQEELYVRRCSQPLANKIAVLNKRLMCKLASGLFTIRFLRSERATSSSRSIRGLASVLQDNDAPSGKVPRAEFSDTESNKRAQDTPDNRFRDRRQGRTVCAACFCIVGTHTSNAHRQIWVSLQPSQQFGRFFSRLAMLGSQSPSGFCPASALAEENAWRRCRSRDLRILGWMM
jgi:hypothetical protein